MYKFQIDNQSQRVIYQIVLFKYIDSLFNIQIQV